MINSMLHNIYLCIEMKLLMLISKLIVIIIITKLYFRLVSFSLG